MIICMEEMNIVIIRTRRVTKMKSTGIIRKLDKLGRVVIPKELRDKLNLLTKDSVEIFKEKAQNLKYKRRSKK